MLHEIPRVRQVPGEPERKWFRSDRLDLVVWYYYDGEIYGFQLTYRDRTGELALTWFKHSGTSHKRVDDGEGRPDRHKMTPILVPDGKLKREWLAAVFREESAELPRDVAARVLAEIDLFDRPPRDLQERLKARFDTAPAPRLTLGWPSAVVLSSADEVCVYCERNKVELTTQDLESLGALAVVLGLGETRWAPPEMVLPALAEITSRIHVRADELGLVAVQQGMENAWRQIAGLEGEPGSAVFEAACDHFLRLLRMPVADDVEG